MERKEVTPSRRKFLKSAAVLAGATAGYTLLSPSVFLLYGKEPGDKNLPWYGIIIDIRRCIGCGSCAAACKNENDVPREPFFFRNWVEHYTVRNDGTVLIESPNGGIDGFSQNVPDEEIFKSFFVPKMCNHCAKSPCEQVCPVGATYTSPEGIVLVDEKYCLGCRYCVQACPYGCRFIHPVKKVANKCTLCYHRLKKNLDPACMEVCPTGARMYGNLRDSNSKIVAFLKEHTTQVLRPHLNTGSKLFYNELSSEVK
ncbi:MAG TPA: 4Fe-4S dicluster domain-containing protein [Bacteroidales bacterium]|nr:4Fe-4S dicluster domain-containing protein [Bacteroidales bacterium]